MRLGILPRFGSLAGVAIGLFAVASWLAPARVVQAGPPSVVVEPPAPRLDRLPPVVEAEAEFVPPDDRSDVETSSTDELGGGGEGPSSGGEPVVVVPLTERDLGQLRVADAALDYSTSVVDLMELHEAPEESTDGAPVDSPSPPRKNPAATAYKGVFYDNDFRYLNAPGDYPLHLGDVWKQLSPIDGLTVDLGGEYRLRHHNEAHLRFSDLSGRSDNFLLERTRLYANLAYGSGLRLFGEAIDATSHWQDYSPRPTEVNRFDALNLFVDARLGTPLDGQFWLRGGRQELLFGEQRLVGPLDWANTRRTFDGFKAFQRSDAFDVDLFWTRPVPFLQHLPEDHNFDRSASRVEFYGGYASYKAIPDHVFDAYYFGLGEYAAVTSVTQTFGGRWKGKRGAWSAEVEAAYQFGVFGDASRSAGMVTVGAGREFERLPWTPTVWAYYDGASGDADPGDGRRGTFNQQFPLVHRYMGFCDLVARENIRDLNVQLVAKPTSQLTLIAWWHRFWLAESRDALYNAQGVPIRFDPTGAAGADVGHELDLLLVYALNARTELQFGYSHFWAGDFVRATNPVGVSGDVDFVYTQFQWRF